jgi:hypothetical protein
VSPVRAAINRFLRRPAPAAPSVAPPPPAKPVVFPGSGGEPFPALREIVEAFSSPTPPERLVLGDSVSLRVANEDRDRRDLGAMVRESLLPVPVLCVAGSAFNLRIYEAFIRVLQRLPTRPRVVIAPINMRSFSPQWHLNPAWQLTAELKAIKAWIADPASPIATIPDVTLAPAEYATYDRLPANIPWSTRETLGSFRALALRREGGPERSRELMAWHYAYRLEPAHPLFGSLDALARACRALGVDLQLFCTPINVEFGRRIVGPPFDDALSTNLAVVHERCRSNGIRLHDWSGALPAAAFFHPETLTEHLAESGRRWLAERIVACLRPQDVGGSDGLC